MTEPTFYAGRRIGTVFAFMTGTRVTWADDDSGDHTEEHGWVDPSWSRTELVHSRNDVRPVLEYRIADDDTPDVLREIGPLAEYAQDVVDRELGAVSDTDGGGTFNAADSYSDPYATDGASWSYAIRFVLKHQDARGEWVETPIDPFTFGPDGHREDV